MNKFIIIFIITIFLGQINGPVFAQTNDNGVYLLQPDIVGLGPNSSESNLGNYLSLIFKTLIAIAGGISTLIIVISGIQYMFTEVPGVKSSAKGRISEALVGLILALAAYLILYTINPDLVNLSLNPEPIKQGTQ